MLTKSLRYAAFTLTLVVGLFGSFFVAGYAFTDLALGIAIAVTSLWVVPMVALSAHALLRPGPAGRVLVVAAFAVTAFAVVDAFFSVFPSDDWGPVTAVMLLALGVALGFLGLHRPSRAGSLLVGVGAVQLVAVVANVVLHETGVLPPGPGLGPSTAVVALWMLLVGGLYRLSVTDEQSSGAGPSSGGRAQVTRDGTSAHAA